MHWHVPIRLQLHVQRDIVILYRVQPRQISDETCTEIPGRRRTADQGSWTQVRPQADYRAATYGSGQVRHVPAFPTQGIFISYRRDDTGPYARLLKDHLAKRLPGRSVFIDLDEIEVGLDFAEVIKAALDSSAVIISLIGPRWLTITDEDGRRRLDDPDDYVRFEIRTGLRRCARLIPVLVDGAKPLRLHDLPGDIQKLARLNALKMSYDRFEYDEDRLTATIRKVLEHGAGNPDAPVVAGGTTGNGDSVSAASSAAAAPAAGSGIVCDGGVSGFDPTRPSAARVYDYLLGGKNHFAADREMAQKLLATAPIARTAARENRAFLGRAVRYLVAEAGVRQFLDIGTGLPTSNNVHEVAQAVDPSARVVYADNDPLVLAHARALLTSSPEGRTSYIQADLRAPEVILAAPAVQEVLDFSQPVALILVAVLHFVLDEFQPAAAIARLLDALPSGSYLAASHAMGEHIVPAERVAATRIYRSSGVPLQVRDSDEFAALAFSGLELVPPGVVLVSEWRPEGRAPRPVPSEVVFCGGVARKP